jgi:hypothetical protein
MMGGGVVYDGLLGPFFAFNVFHPQTASIFDHIVTGARA